jgi:hypothetical protein
LQVKSQVPVAEQVGVALATPAQFRQREPHAVTVVAGTQLPPQRLVVGGHVHWLRIGSQICPPEQLVFVWQPKAHMLVRASQ